MFRVVAKGRDHPNPSNPPKRANKAARSSVVSYLKPRRTVECAKYILQIFSPYIPRKKEPKNFFQVKSRNRGIFIGLSAQKSEREKNVPRNEGGRKKFANLEPEIGLICIRKQPQKSFSQENPKPQKSEGNFPFFFLPHASSPPFPFWSGNNVVLS